MADGGLATPGTKASAAIVLTLFFKNIPRHRKENNDFHGGVNPRFWERHWLLWCKIPNDTIFIGLFVCVLNIFQCELTSHLHRPWYPGFKNDKNQIWLYACVADSSETGMNTLLLTWIISKPSISKYIHHKVWDEITYSFPNFSGTVNPC